MLSQTLMIQLILRWDKQSEVKLRFLTNISIRSYCQVALRSSLNSTVTLAIMCISNSWCSVSVATAQEIQVPVISTERPTVGNSPDLIPAHSLQVENGINVTFQRDHYMVDFPETLLRLGITDRAELRFLFQDEMYQRPDIPGTASFQALDPTISIKLGLGKPTSIYPRSVIAQLSFPAGGPSWTSGSYDPSITTIWTQTISKNYFLNEVVGGTLTTLFGARRMYWAPSIAGGRSLSPAITGFAEYAPTLPANDNWSYIIDAGFSLTHNKVNQFDFRTGYLKDSVGFHGLFSVGYSVRRDGLFRRESRRF